MTNTFRIFFSFFFNISLRLSADNIICNLKYFNTLQKCKLEAFSLFRYVIKQRKRWIQVGEGLVKHICACEGALERGWQNGGGIHTKTKLSSGSISLLGLSVVKLAEPDRMIDCFVRVPG